MNSSEEFDSNPFNYQPLKRRKKSLLKPQTVKRVKTSYPITSQKPTYVQKTLSFRTETGKPFDQKQRKIEGNLVNILVSLRLYCVIFQSVLCARFL